MFKVFAHRTHWSGLDEVQNTLEGMGMGIAGNFNMEIDVRFAHIEAKEPATGKIIRKTTPFLSHDKMDAKENPFPLEIMFAKFEKEFLGRNITLALHLKEGWENAECLKEMQTILNLFHIKKFFFFGFETEAQKEIWAKIFGWDKVAFEIETTGEESPMPKFKEALTSQSKVIWVAELGSHWLLPRDYEALKEAGKQVVVVSPDCFSKDFPRFLQFLENAFLWEGLFHGVCTDHPALFTQYGSK